MVARGFMALPLLMSVQVGMPRDIPREADSESLAGETGRTWRTAFLKTPVVGAVHVGKETVAGDGQADLRYHGGEDRPVLAYCGDHYRRWEAELGYTAMPFGGFGENFTISGIDEGTVCLGDRYKIGPVRVEASQPRQPCWKLARRWQNQALPELVIKHNRGGWYFRVLEEGFVEAGMSVELYDRPYPPWTIARAMEVYYREKKNAGAHRVLASLPPLSEQWRSHFTKLLTV
jgi:MOSC domain-containing protein YiiM